MMAFVSNAILFLKDSLNIATRLEEMNTVLNKAGSIFKNTFVLVQGNYVVVIVLETFELLQVMQNITIAAAVVLNVNSFILPLFVDKR